MQLEEHERDQLLRLARARCTRPSSFCTRTRASHDPAATTTAKPETTDYLAFLRSSTAKTILEKYGFKFLISPTP